MNPDELDQIEDAYDDIETAFEQAERSHRIAANRNYRSDDSRAVALREAEEDLLAAATALTAYAETTTTGIIAGRERLTTPDFGFAASALRSKPQVAALLRADITDLPLEDLAADLRSALRSGDRVSLAAFVRWLPSRLRSEPTARTEPGPDGTLRRLPDTTEARNALSTMLTEAKATITPEPDDDLLGRLDALRDRVSKGSRRAKDRLPRRPYSFQQPGDVIRETA